jgi:hypothetical protein
VPLFYPFDKTGFLKIPEEHEAQLSWLNEPFRSEHEKAIQKGLKRSTFKAPEGGWKRQLQKLETDIL